MPRRSEYDADLRPLGYFLAVCGQARNPFKPLSAIPRMYDPLDYMFPRSDPWAGIKINGKTWEEFVGA